MTQGLRKNGWISTSIVRGQAVFSHHPLIGEIRVNNITRRVVANPIPDLQRDLGEIQMSLIEHAIAASRKTAAHHDPSLANKPAPKVAILTCMDPRLNQLLEWLDIKPADARCDPERRNGRNDRCGAVSDVFDSRSRRARGHGHRAHWLRNGNVFGRRLREPPPHTMRHLGRSSRQIPLLFRRESGDTKAGTETQVAPVDSFEGGNSWICFRFGDR